MASNTIINQLAQGQPGLAGAAGGAVASGISSGIDAGMKLRTERLDQQARQLDISKQERALADWDMQEPVRRLTLDINKDRLLEEYTQLPLEFQVKTQEHLSKLDAADTKALENELTRTKEVSKLFFDVKDEQDYAARKQAFPDMFSSFGFTGEFTPEVKSKMDTLARVSSYSEQYIQNHLATAGFDPKVLATFGKDTVSSSMYLMKEHPDAGVRAAAEGSVLMSMAGKITKVNAPAMAKMLYPGDKIKQEELLKWAADISAPAPRAGGSAGTRASAVPKAPVYKPPQQVEYTQGRAVFDSTLVNVDGAPTAMSKALGLDTSTKQGKAAYNEIAVGVSAGVTSLAHKLAWQEATYLNRNTTTAQLVDSVYTFLMTPSTGFQETVRTTKTFAGIGMPGTSTKKVVLNTGVLQSRLEMYEAKWLAANGSSIAAWKQMQSTGVGVVPPGVNNKVSLSEEAMLAFRKKKGGK